MKQTCVAGCGQMCSSKTNETKIRQECVTGCIHMCYARNTRNDRNARNDRNVRRSRLNSFELYPTFCRLKGKLQNSPAQAYMELTSQQGMPRKSKSAPAIVRSEPVTPSGPSIMTILFEPPAYRGPDRYSIARVMRACSLI